MFIWLCHVWVYFCPPAELWNAWSFGPALAVQKAAQRDEVCANSAKNRWERIHHFLQWRKCIARQQRMKKSYFGYDNDGETFSQSLGLRRHAITQHQLPGAAHATSFIRAEVSSNEISILPTFGWAWARPGILTMGMICNSSCWTWHLLPDPTTLPIALHPLLSQGFPVWGRYHAPTWLSQCVWRQLLGLKAWSLFTFFEIIFFF